MLLTIVTDLAVLRTLCGFEQSNETVTSLQGMG